MRAAFPFELPRPLLAGALAVGLVAFAAACGTGGISTGGDVTHGKQVFSKPYSTATGTKYSCSTCHTLAAAGAVGTIGPNLDNAFSAVRKQGFKDSTIQQVVADQIRIPLQSLSCPSAESRASGYTTACQEGTPVTPTGTAVMPANLVSGKDLTDVAAFVATCAGNPTNASCTGGKITSTDGKTIFLTAGCTGCHTLKDAGSTGNVGPNLDQRKPPASRVITRVTNGKGAMPSFKSKLTAQQIQAVAKYVSSVAGK